VYSLVAGTVLCMYIQNSGVYLVKSKKDHVEMV
jgi:hypothetical protein